MPLRDDNAIDDFCRYRPQRVKGVDINVPAVLNEAEVHILGRSSSSTHDQLMFIETRCECLKEIKERVSTSCWHNCMYFALVMIIV